MIDVSFTYSDLEYFLLILVRVSSFVYIVPFFHMGNVPMRFRMALSVVVSVLMYGILTPHPELVYHSVMGFAILVMKEFVSGILIGMGVNLCMAILSVTGAVADMEVGFSMVTLMNPATREQTTITSTLYQYLMMLILVISGMYEYIFGALSDSYQLIPVGGAIFRSDSILHAMLAFMSDYLSIGFRICLPIFAAILLLNVVLGVMAKVSPQMNMFAVGIQLKVLIGILIIFFTVPLLPIATELIFTEIKRVTVSFVEAIM